MSYAARVVQVMIASPSDVATERGVVRTVINEWNDLNSERSAIVLLPVGWETHAVPQMGERAQKIINRDVLRRCDVLVAIFWTRIGSPTGDHPSGTVEEVREHIAAGKLAMVYFSSAPVRLDSVDEDQYGRLREFRKECEENGLIETFESPTKLRDKLFRQLSRIVPERFQSEAKGLIEESANRAPMPDVSPEGRALLRAASRDEHGSILYLKVLGGPIIQAAGEQLNDPRIAREQARWDSALEELESEGLIRAKSYKREIFTLTAAGYELADQLADS
jgi:hypothetical protein